MRVSRCKSYSAGELCLAQSNVRSASLSGPSHASTVACWARWPEPSSILGEDRGVPSFLSVSFPQPDCLAWRPDRHRPGHVTSKQKQNETGLLGRPAARRASWLPTFPGRRRLFVSRVCSLLVRLTGLGLGLGMAGWHVLCPTLVDSSRTPSDRRAYPFLLHTRERPGQQGSEQMLEGLEREDCQVRRVAPAQS